MKRDWIKNLSDKIGENCSVFGWVHSRRDHGKIVFLDIRDMTGIVQVVFVPGSKAYKKISNIRPEWVINVSGKVNKRPDNMINKNNDTGTIELEAFDIEILNESKTPPFEIDKNTLKVDEELRLKYRYLDIRTERMNKNITLRHEIVKFLRDYLYKRNFREIETPYLTKSTPEGAREYMVPSRMYPGNFYVLPQSPQQFKQLLMVGGIERYFQIARCFRDEDQRGDRQPEFTQLDIEMSFVNEEDIFNLIEPMMIEMVKKMKPEAKITKTPFPRIKYDDALAKYKTDKPDLRNNKNDNNEFAFAWIVDIPMFAKSESENKLVSVHHPFTSPRSEDETLLDSKPQKAKAMAYDLALNGFEIFGGSIRIHKREIQEKVFKILGISEEEKERRFGHMLKAFEYGAPPHGGIAAGIDRMCAVFCGEKAIREVIAFPKTGDARDPMMGAPSKVSKEQLNAVHIQLKSEASSQLLNTKDTQTNE